MGPKAQYSHPIYGTAIVVLHGRDPRLWDGRGGWTFQGILGQEGQDNR